MNATIRTIPLSQAEPGMVLASDVTLGGKVLLPAGAVLDADRIEGLARREVAEIAVPAGAARSEAQIEELRAVQRRRVDRLFRRAGSDATMQALRRALLDYRLKAIE